MAFIEPMHRNKPNITYLLPKQQILWLKLIIHQSNTLVSDRCLYDIDRIISAISVLISQVSQLLLP